MSENRNVVINLGSVSLCNTLGDPDNITTFLLLQTNVRVENTKMKLLHERLDIDLHLFKSR